MLDESSTVTRYSGRAAGNLPSCSDVKVFHLELSPLCCEIQTALSSWLYKNTQGSYTTCRCQILPLAN